MNDVGWISLHRKIQDCFIWDIRPFSWGQSWIDLLLLANHKDANVVFAGSMITVGMGQRIVSMRMLAERWGWSRTKVSHFLDILEEENMITKESDTKKTLLTIVNYEKYQTTSANQVTQKSLNNNDNNVNILSSNNDISINNKLSSNNNIYIYNPPLSPLKEDWDKRSNKDNLIAYLNSGEYPNTDVFKQHPGLYEAIKEWMEYKDARKPKSQNHYANTTSMMKFLNKAVRCLDIASEDAVIEIINDSLGNNYQGITWDRLIKGQAKPKAKVDRSGWTDD